MKSSPLAQRDRRTAQNAGDVRIEQAIATSRLLLAVAGVASVSIALVPDARPGAIYRCLAAYAIVGLLYAVDLRGRRRVPRTFGAFGAFTHLMDIGMAGAMALLTGTQSSLFFVFLSYPLLTAAYRWGLGGTLATALTALVLLIGMESVAMFGGGRSLNAPNSASSTASGPLMYATYLAVVGLLVGYLSNVERKRLAEALSVSHMLRTTRVGATFEETCDGVLRATVLLFRARRAILVMREFASGRTFVRDWQAGTDAESLGEPTRELPKPVGDAHLFPLPGAAVHAVRQWSARDTFRLAAVDGEGLALPRRAVTLPAAFLAEVQCRRLVIASMKFERRWVSRVFVLDPAFVFDREELARVAQRVIGQVGPALFEHFKLQRVGGRASRAERARIVRELHDGPIQSLLGVEMELAVLRRKAHERGSELEPDLARFHGTVKREVVGLREVFEGVRAGTAPPRPIQQDLEDLVTRFAIYTGLNARYIGDDHTVVLPYTFRREVLRIAHEALANVRKHSGAQRVVVRSIVQGGQLLLHVEDNGKGFRWAGVRTQADLRAQGDGPWTILDRVTAIDGRLTITSKPGLGASLEMVCALPARQKAIA